MTKFSYVFLLSYVKLLVKFVLIRFVTQNKLFFLNSFLDICLGFLGNHCVGFILTESADGEDL